jgi:hypothetical protein
MIFNYICPSMVIACILHRSHVAKFNNRNLDVFEYFVFPITKYILHHFIVYWLYVSTTKLLKITTATTRCILLVYFVD